MREERETKPGARPAPPDETAPEEESAYEGEDCWTLRLGTEVDGNRPVHDGKQPVRVDSSAFDRNLV